MSNDVMASAKARVAELEIEGMMHLKSYAGQDHLDGADPACLHCDDIFGEASLLSDLLAEIARLSKATPAAWIWHHDHQAALIAKDGWMCEQHVGREWPHDDCAGPGMPWVIEDKAEIARLQQEKDGYSNSYYEMQDKCGDLAERLMLVEAERDQLQTALREVIAEMDECEKWGTADGTVHKGMVRRWADRFSALLPGRAAIRTEECQPGSHVRPTPDGPCQCGALR